MLGLLLLVLAPIVNPLALAAADPSPNDPAAEFPTAIRPLLASYCLDCHSATHPKGDLDLERLLTTQDARRETDVWERVLDQVSLGEMPPKNKPQPSPAERERLLRWIHTTLEAAALATAGDPGPVVLRRLNNAEYTYTVRDLTGVETLHPARQFPPDSAAGEGFMNTGASLVMSPALLTKYLDAAKDIAQHAVLLPDGFRFSAATTRRDWTEEILADIRRLYRQYTQASGADRVNLQGVVFDTNEGGRLPLEAYLRAAFERRQGPAPSSPLPHPHPDHPQPPSPHASPPEPLTLSPRYLDSLLALLESGPPSPILDPIRARWRMATTQSLPTLANDIASWQSALWKFSAVGHIGKAGGPSAWMEPVDPLASQQEVRLKLTAPTNQADLVLCLTVSDAGDGHLPDFVLWQNPRLVTPGRPDLPLRALPHFIQETTARRHRVVNATAACLAAAHTALTSTPRDPATLARLHAADPDALEAWLHCLGLGFEDPLPLDYLTNTLHQASGYDFARGWGSPDTPLFLANTSTQAVRIPGRLKAHGIVAHPSPTLAAAVGWRSPVAAVLRVEARVTHAHPECGNGVAWTLEHRRGSLRQHLAEGVAHGASPAQVGPIDHLPVQPGDLLSLVIGPRQGNHACDLTDLEFTLRPTDDTPDDWHLTRDVAVSFQAVNPHPDTQGRPGVWHFYTEPASSGPGGPWIPPGSLLARWLATNDATQRASLATNLQHLLQQPPDDTTSAADRQLRRQLLALTGPLLAGTVPNPPSTPASPASSPSEFNLPAPFGLHPNGSPRQPDDLCVQAPSRLEIRLPADLAHDAEFVATVLLDPETAQQGSVQIAVSANAPGPGPGWLPGLPQPAERRGDGTSPDPALNPSAPILVAASGPSRQRFEAACHEFRQWFPPALCYVKIVPVDEVVTLTLYHREDHHLARLLLTDEERTRLDRLWDELHYVSRDALTLVDAYEQLWQYATQDADPKVFEPMRQPIHDRAAAFRQQLAASEPRHLNALLDFAARAYRRPLAPRETQELAHLYQQLRREELSHEDAFRLALARVFVAPAFLYRLEHPAPGHQPGPVSDWELASRLSYFLWSSTPDPALRDAVRAGQLQSPTGLVAQVRRLLQDPRARRLATEFACTWLHIHDFENLDEKSERHFPTFASLRGPLYEEAIRFFTDLFQHNRPVLAILDADYAFLNEPLAAHYGIPGVLGPEWRRVDHVRPYGRGGVLAFGATLAKQSGASRTSPILRGNWVADVLLGDKLPRPPKDVPRLPEDEAAASLTMRQLVEKHSSDPRCASCHVRIDPLGYALETYDAIGRRRSHDLAGHPIDARATLFDGTAVAGPDELRHYLLTKKRDAFLRQFCRKLLGYALGRSVQLSDLPLVAEMQRTLREQNYRVHAAVETIVLSPQFRQIRGQPIASTP